MQTVIGYGVVAVGAYMLADFMPLKEAIGVTLLIIGSILSYPQNK